MNVELNEIVKLESSIHYILRFEAIATFGNSKCNVSFEIEKTALSKEYKITHIGEIHYPFIEAKKLLLEKIVSLDQQRLLDLL
jgi:hypothetical protein